MKAKDSLVRDMHAAKNVTRTFPGFMGHAHVHTLWALGNSLGLQQGRQCRQETHIPRGSHTTHSPTQSEPWHRPQTGLFSALAALGNGGNIVSLTPYPSPRLCFFLPVSLGPWPTSPCPAQPAHRGDTDPARRPKVKICKESGEKGKGGRKILPVAGVDTGGWPK